MVLLRAIEMCLALFFVFGVITQIAIPLITEKPLFPFFSRERKLKKELEEARRKREEAELEAELREEQLGAIRDLYEQSLDQPILPTEPITTDERKGSNEKLST